MELLKLYTAVLRRKWLLLQAVVFFTLCGVVAAFALPKQYKATAKLMVSSSSTTESVLSDLGLQEVAQGLSGETDEIQNHIALSTSRPILEEVIWRLQLRSEDGALLNPDKLLIPGVDAPLTAPPQVEVTQYQGTDIILMTATSSDPELSRLMADTLARVYIADTRERARRETREARQFVESRLAVVRADFDRALNDIADAQKRRQVVDLDAQVKSAIARLADLMAAAEENAAKIDETRARMQALRDVQGRERPDHLGPATVQENPDIRAAREQLANLVQERETLLLDKTASHPDVVRVDRQIEVTRQALEDLLAEQHDLDPTLVELEAELAGLVRRGTEIQEAIDRQSALFGEYPEKMRELAELQLAASSAEEIYRSLQDQSYQIAIAEAMTVSPLQLIEPAQKPERHVFPKLLPNLVAGFGLGLLVGLGLVGLFEYIDDSVKTPDDLRECWDIAQLGIVPRYRRAGTLPTIADLAPTDPLVEAFRTLRSAIGYATLDAPAHLLAVTSALPSEGKSTVLVNLAISYAQEGRRVLIVDCDLRRPSQHRFWPGSSNEHGVTTVLLGERSLAEAIQHTGVEGLDLLSSGPVPPNPGKLVESLKLRQLLLEASRSYDLVLVDTPPVMVVNDASFVGRVVDHVIMLVESGATSRRVLADARNRLETGGIQPLGLVLNKLDYSTAGYGYYYYHRAYRTYLGGRTPRGRGAEKRGGAA